MVELFIEAVASSQFCPQGLVVRLLSNEKSGHISGLNLILWEKLGVQD